MYILQQKQCLSTGVKNRRCLLAIGYDAYIVNNSIINDIIDK